MEVPLSIGSRSWLNSGERISSRNIWSPSWFNAILLDAICCWLSSSALLCRDLLPFLSILQAQTPGRSVKWVYVPTLHREFATGSERDFPKCHFNAWLKHFSSSQSFSFSSCVPKPCGEWGMSTRVLLTHCTASLGRSSSASAAIPGAGSSLGADGHVAISSSQARVLSSSCSPASFSVQCLN